MEVAATPDGTFRQATPTLTTLDEDGWQTIGLENPIENMRYVRVVCTCNAAGQMLESHRRSRSPNEPAGPDATEVELAQRVPDKTGLFCVFFS